MSDTLYIYYQVVGKDGGHVGGPSSPSTDPLSIPVSATANNNCLTL